MNPMELRWGIKARRTYPPQDWALSIGIFHWGEETYFYINLIFVNISFGKQYMREEE